MTTKVQRQLEQARSDLAAATAALSSSDEQKADAVKSSKTYSQWRISREELELEVERLALLVERLQADLERERADAASAALATRRETLEQESAALALRIREEGAAAAAVLVELAERAKANAHAVEMINRELAEDKQLLPADHLARHRDPAARENLGEEEIIDLWTFESGGDLVSNPDDVRELSYERGIIPATGYSSRNTPVVRKRFRKIRYLEQGEREWAEPLASVLRLPRFDAPGRLFDFGRAVEPAERRELIELLPADGAPARPASVEAEAA